MVKNLSESELKLTIYPQDAVLTEQGSFDLKSAEEVATEVGSWIDLPSQEISLAAGEVKFISFNVEVPIDATPGDHAGGVVAALTPTNPGGLTVAPRIGMRVYVRVNGEAVAKISTTELAADYQHRLIPLAKGEAKVRFVTKNEGNVRLHSAVHLQISSDLTSWQRTIAVPDFPELQPGQEIATELLVPAVPASGSYTVQVLYSNIHSAQQELTEVAEISSPSFKMEAFPYALVVTLIVLAAVTWLLISRSRRKKSSS